MLKKALSGFLALALLCACWAAPAVSVLAEGYTVDECGLRGWDLNAGYQYVIMGYYPYYVDKNISKKEYKNPEKWLPENYSEEAKAPVLWQVLSVKDGKALLYTTYIIDAHQPTEVSGKAAEKHKYPDISDYGETDLNRWLNETMINDLLGDEPVLAAVTEEQYGRLYPLIDYELMTEEYGFTHQRFYEVRSRWAYATPYALNKKLYKDYGGKVAKDQSHGTSSYWVANMKRDDKTGEQIRGKYLQLCAGIADPHEKGGTNIGHLSVGYLNRTTVGLRLAVRLDTSKIQVVSGNGSIWDPCRLAYVEDKSAEQPVAVTPPVRPGPTPEPTLPAQVKDRPKLETPGPDVTPVPVPEWANGGAD